MVMIMSMFFCYFHSIPHLTWINLNNTTTCILHRLATPRLHTQPEQRIRMSARLSGLQKDVLALYRSILREAIRKDRKATIMPSSPSSLLNVEPHRIPVSSLLSTSTTSTTAYAREKFRKEALSLKRSDFKTIEYKIRKGKKQLQLLTMPGVDLVGGA